MRCVIRILSCLGIGDESQREEHVALIDEISDAFSIYLCDLWQYFRRHPSDKLKLGSLADIGIRYKESNLGGSCAEPFAHTFFSPMEIKELKSLTPDMTAREI